MTKFIGIDFKPIMVKRPELAAEIEKCFSQATPPYFVGTMTVEALNDFFSGEDIGEPYTNEGTWATMVDYYQQNYDIGNISAELLEIFKTTKPQIIDIP